MGRESRQLALGSLFLWFFFIIWITLNLVPYGAFIMYMIMNWINSNNKFP